MYRNGREVTDEVSNYISALPIACIECGGMVPAPFLFLHYRQNHSGNRSFDLLRDYISRFYRIRFLKCHCGCVAMSTQMYLHMLDSHPIPTFHQRSSKRTVKKSV